MNGITDRIMSRIWNSPWTRLAYAIAVLLLASTYTGTWFWVLTAIGICSLWSFLSRGSRRWGT